MVAGSEVFFPGGGAIGGIVFAAESHEWIEGLVRGKQVLS